MSDTTKKRIITGWGLIPFLVGVDPTWGTLSDFSHSAVLVTRHVPGGNVHITQTLGLSRRRVTYHIWTETREDFASLLTRIGQTDTLTVVKGSTVVTGVTITQHGGVYLKIPNVMLMALDDIKLWIAGEVEAQATFEVDYA